MTAPSLSRTVVTCLLGQPGQWGPGEQWWRVVCRTDRGGCGWWMDADTWRDAWHLERDHDCTGLEALAAAWEAEAKAYVHAAPIGSPDWADLLPTRQPPTIRPRRFRHLAAIATAGIRGNP